MRRPVVTYDLDYAGAAVTETAFRARVQSRIDRLAVHAERVGSVVFDDRVEAEQLLEWLAGQINMPGTPKGRALFHMCEHADGEPATGPCTDPAAELMVRT